MQNPDICQTMHSLAGISLWPLTLRKINFKLAQGSLRPGRARQKQRASKSPCFSRTSGHWTLDTGHCLQYICTPSCRVACILCLERPQRNLWGNLSTYHSEVNAVWASTVREGEGMMFCCQVLVPEPSFSNFLRGFIFPGLQFLHLFSS